MNQLPRGVTKILVACMGAHRAHALRSIVNRWLRCSGPEWTVGRLKALRTGAMHLRAGNRKQAITIWQQNSVSYNHGTAIPKGIYGTVIMDYVHGTNAQSLKRLDAILRIYTTIRCNSLTHAQFIKAKKAITGPSTADPEIIQQVSQLIRTNAGKTARIGELLPVDVSRLSAFSNTHCEHDGDNEVANMAWGRLVRSLWTSVYLPESVIPHNPAEVMRTLLVESGADNTIAGHISFIQEGGAKARVVAVPNAWCQGLFQPLHQRLDSLAKKIDQSCLHDQNKGAQFIRAEMEKGKTLYCFDLSSATDRFPIQLEQAALEGFGLEDWSRAFGEISKAPWRVRVRVDGSQVDEIWHYQTGQPMGLYGSFPLFHLTHFLLLIVCCQLTGRKEAYDSFRVLGDDVVISDPHLAKAYNNLLLLLGVEVSPTKTIISDHLAEFAGFVAHKTTKGIFVYRPYKYSPSGDFTSPINLLESLGNKCRILGDYWARKYEYYVFTKSWRNPDLSPILPGDDKDGKPVPGLNSHLLGSLSNRFSYALTFEPSQDLLEVYEAQQLLLLGQKERCTPSGFASANLNPLGILMPEKDEIDEYSPSYRVSNDPLMREASTGELRDKGKSITKTGNSYCLTEKLDL